MANKQAHVADAKTLIKANIRNYSMFLIFVLIMLIFGVLCGLQNSNNWFINFTARNFTNIFFQYSYVFILATGMVLTIIILGIDLSVGSVCAFVGALSVMVYNATGGSMLLAVVAALVIGLAIGAFQGSIIAFPKIPAFIVTLAGMWLFRGLTYIVTKISPVNPINDGYAPFSTGTLDESFGIKPLILQQPTMANGLTEVHLYPLPIIIAIILLAIYIIGEVRGRKRQADNGFEIAPMSIFIGKIIIICALVLYLCERFAQYRGMPIVALVVGITVAVFQFMMTSTTIGRYIYAVGGNARAADLSGISSTMINFIVFCLMGLLAGLAAVVSTGYMNSALPQAGNGFEMDAIASCYIGGVSAAGGVGTVVGVIVGGLVMSAINNGMSLMNLGTHYQYVV
jgi:putative multiple sugar transport system permease protein